MRLYIVTYSLGGLFRQASVVVSPTKLTDKEITREVENGLDHYQVGGMCGVTITDCGQLNGKHRAVSRNVDLSD